MSIGKKQVKQLSKDLLLLMYETLQEKEGFIYKNDTPWYDHMPDTWTKEEGEKYDLLSDFLDRVQKRLDALLIAKTTPCNTKK